MTNRTLEHDIVYITARIQVQIPNTTNISIGTGFFYSASLGEGKGSLLLLVSNKHVYSDPKGKLTVTLNTADESGKPRYGVTREFTDIGFEASYYAHPDSGVDLACIEANGVWNFPCYVRNLADEFLDEIDYESIPPTTRVVFVGYPDGRFDVVNNLPLVRSGSIASLPTVDFNGKGQIVLDAQVHQGSSGSPVFVMIKGRYYLLGVISETMVKHQILQTVTVNITSLGVQQVIGLGIAIKQRHVRELIQFAVEQFKLRRGVS